MRTRTLVVAAAAVALVGVATLVMTRSERSSPLPGDRPEAAPPPGEPGRPLAPAFPPGGRAREAGAGPRGVVEPLPPVGAPPGSAAAPEELDPSWRESRVVFRLREVGPVGVYVQTGLRRAREEMAHCFEAAARDAGESAAARDAEAVPAVLVLYLEERQGAVDVVDVRVDRLGTKSPELVACCRDVLRGHEMPAPSTVPGRRYRLPFDLE